MRVAAQAGSGACYRLLNNYLYYFLGGLGYKYSILGPKTLVYLLRSLYYGCPESPHPFESCDLAPCMRCGILIRVPYFRKLPCPGRESRVLGVWLWALRSDGLGFRHLGTVTVGLELLQAKGSVFALTALTGILSGVELIVSSPFCVACV